MNDWVELTVTTESLDKAIEILKTRLPETLYQQAWRALTDERERRRQGASALSIVLARFARSSRLDAARGTWVSRVPRSTGGSTRGSMHSGGTLPVDACAS